MKDISLLKIIKATYEHDLVLRLTFSTGEVRLCDFMPLAQRGICTKLQDINYFRSFTLDPYTVDWNNEIGFAPEYLYEISTPIPYDLDQNEPPKQVADDSSIS